MKKGSAQQVGSEARVRRGSIGAAIIALLLAVVARYCPHICCARSRWLLVVLLLVRALY
jgi:hypothetical protein